MSERIEVSGSLYATLRAAYPDLQPTLASKGTLVATSHLIEDVVAAAEGASVLVSGFQRGRFWQVERDRYLALADRHEVLGLFATGEPDPASGIDHIGLRLRPADPLAQEWFVLARGPGVAVLLCGLDDDAAAVDPTVPETERLFEALWTLDAELVDAAIDLVLGRIVEDAPEHAERLSARLAAVRGAPLGAEAIAASAGRLLRGLVERVERFRAEETRVRRELDERDHRHRLAVARQLQDGPVQSLAVARMAIELAREELRAEAAKGLPEEPAALLEQGLGALQSAIGETREAMREVAPHATDADTLDAHLTDIATAVHPEAEVEVSDPDGHLDTQPATASLALRLAAELVRNVEQHADAALARIELRAEDGEVRLEVVDHGPGGCPSTSPPGRFGLASVRHRVEVRGGTFEVDSDEDGTTVRLRLPARVGEVEP
ncbi:MAG: DICT sensory domain-containing protein [Egibacteraceae bacterium]